MTIIFFQQLSEINRIIQGMEYNQFIMTKENALALTLTLISGYAANDASPTLHVTDPKNAAEVWADGITP